MKVEYYIAENLDPKSFRKYELFKHIDHLVYYLGYVDRNEKFIKAPYGPAELSYSEKGSNVPGWKFKEITKKELFVYML